MVVVWASAAIAVEGLAEREARGKIAVEPAVTVEHPTFVLANGTVWTAAGQRYDRGYVVVKDGRISGVGAGDAPAIEGATVLDVSGRFVTPGIIDTHSHLGVYPMPGDGSAHADGNEATAPTTAGVWAEHSVWPQDPGFELAIAGGITAMQILPGSANLIGGRGFVIQNVPTRGARGMRFPGAPETVKMACGENPKRVYGDGKGTTPSTRMGNLRGQRKAFLDAQSYGRAWADFESASTETTSEKKRKRASTVSNTRTQPDRDLDKETLLGVLNGTVLPEVHCYRADDMLAMLQVAEEFGFRVRSFHHATDAYKIRDVLASREVAASVWSDWWGFKLEAYDAIPEGAALLAEAGARAVIHSDSAVGIQRLNQEAAKAYYDGVRAGVQVSEEDALRWITINPAWALGIDKLTGSLEVGKRADVVVWDGSPFSVYTRAQLVFVDGVLRYDHARPVEWSDYTQGQMLEVRR